nr:uncharacterized protein LOC126526594 [Dermacentor andersoni]
MEFSSQEFAVFAASYGFNHVTSSPHYAQSNGEAERMVRTIKDLFPHLALLSYRDTPGVDGFSPAQLLMGRQLRTRVPKQDTQLRPNWPPTKDVVAKDVAYKQKQANYNRHHGARDLPPLQTGQRVWLRPDHLVPFAPTTFGEKPPSPQQVPRQEPQPANGAESTVPLGQSAQQSPAVRDRSDGVIRAPYGRPVVPPRRLNL